MGAGFSNTEECVWKGLAACHGAEEIHAQCCTPFNCLLICCFLLWGLFFFARWYPSSPLLRNPSAISPGLWLSWLCSPSPCAWTLLVPCPQSASLGARKMTKHKVLHAHLSQQLPAHARGDCEDLPSRLREIWQGCAWQSRHQLCSSNSPALGTEFDSICKVTSRKSCQGQRSCHRTQEKEN